MQHENTRIYQKSLELNQLCARVIKRMPTGSAFLSDQLKRAASSVTLNFAEGCRRASSKDRHRFFTTAAASASEVSAVIDVVHTYEAVSDDERGQAKELCNHISAMLRNFR